MKKILGWIGLVLVALIGAALSVGSLIIFAPHAPTLLMLILLPLLLAGVAAFLIGRLMARPAGLRRATAGWLAAAGAVLPMGGLVAAVLLSPQLPRAHPAPDPRGPHRTLRTTAGSSIAWWSMDAPVRTHRTPVIFLHGGPGGFSTNRDFAVG